MIVFSRVTKIVSKPYYSFNPRVMGIKSATRKFCVQNIHAHICKSSKTSEGVGG